MTTRLTRLAVAVLLAVLVTFFSPTASRAQTTEYLDHAAFVVAAGPTTTVGFDTLAPCDGCLTGIEFAGQGLTIVQLDGLAMNIVRNLAPGGFGANFVTEANVSSAPNVLSSSIFTTSAHDISDNFDFIFATPVRSAGLFIGNVASTAVQFLDAAGGVIASRTLTTATPGMLFGPTGQAFDNRIFYGIVSAIPIHRIRVIDPAGDGDGLTFDDVEFSPVDADGDEIFLHGSGANANPSVLFLDGEGPTGSTAKNRDSAGVKFAGGNAWKTIGTWVADPAVISGTVSGLGDLRVWLGLKNSDDAGTRFDLAAEVWKNGDLVAEGEALCITGVTRNPALAKEVTISFPPFSPITFNGSSDVLSLKVFTRIGTNGSGGFCGGHGNAAGLRLYFDAADRDSGFSVNPSN